MLVIALAMLRVGLNYRTCCSLVAGLALRKSCMWFNASTPLMRNGHLPHDAVVVACDMLMGEEQTCSQCAAVS